MELEMNTPVNWVKTTLEENVSVIAMGPFGSNLKRDMFTKEGVPIIKGTNLSGMYVDGDFTFVSEDKATSLRKAIAYPNDIIITHRGTIGQVSLVPQNKYKRYVTSQSQLRFSCDSTKLDFKYILYFLRSRIGQYELLKSSSQVGVPAIATPTKSIKEIELTLPPLPEQKAIANVLTAFDDKIELLQQQNQTLETIAQTIFKKWFGKYQLGDELPEGWRVGKINEFIEISLGGDYGKEVSEDDFTEKTICLRGTDLPVMKMSTPEKAPVRYLKQSKLEKCKLENGDIVIEISGGTENQSTGRVIYINNEILDNAHLPMTCVNFCRIIRPIKTDYSYFLYSLFNYLYNRKVMFSWENGTTGIKNLNLKALLEDFDLLIPKSLDKIVEFNELVKSSFVKIQINNTQIQSLTKTRDTLLPKLMSGQVRVKIKQNEIREDRFVGNNGDGWSIT